MLPLERGASSLLTVFSAEMAAKFAVRILLCEQMRLSCLPVTDFCHGTGIYNEIRTYHIGNDCEEEKQ